MISISNYCKKVIKKLSALKTIDELERRAKKGSKIHALNMLKKVSDGKPFVGDEMIK